jgi:glycerophosphoryl diester phosphodiesterase
MKILHPYLDHIGPIPFAHRGGASSAPENTMAAFADAVQLGYRYVETDVHATADGQLVAFHDPDLERTCGIKAKISDLTWDELSRARVSGTETIPLLDDLLSTWPELRLNIDCKSDSAVQPLINSLRAHNCLDRVCIGSFSDARLKTIRETFGNELCSSMGPREVATFVAQVHARRTPRTLAAQCAQVPVKQGPLTVTSQRFVDTAHKVGLAVHVWTIDQPMEMSSLLDMNVDGIMTDNTRALKDVFSARGLWH